MTNPTTRYISIVHGLRRAAHGGKAVADWMRLGAILALTDDRPAADLVRAVDKAAYALRHHAGWSADLATPAQWPVAGLVVSLGLDAHRFAYECETVCQRLHDGGMPNAGTWAPYVVGALRQWESLWPVGPETVQAMGGLFFALKNYHRWTTGPDDLAVCATLVGNGGATAQEIEALDRGISDIFAWSGNDVQAAACLLALGGKDVAPLVNRFRAVVDAFIELRSEIWQIDPAALALVVLGGHDPQAAAAEVLNAFADVTGKRLLGEPAVDLTAAVAIHLAGLPAIHSAGIHGRRLRAALTVVVGRLEHRLLSEPML